MNAKEQRSKWRERIRQIHEDVRGTAWATSIYQGTYEVVTANAESIGHSSFLGWLSHCYSDSVLMGLRRQVTDHKGDASLRNLLCEIHEHTDLISREFHASNYHNSPHRAPRDWDDLVGEKHHTYPRDRVAQQVSELEAIDKLIKTYVDMRVAHLDPRQTMADGGMFQQTYDAVEKIKRLTVHWRLILTAEHLEPQAALEPNWTDLFRRPWIPFDV